MPQAAFADSTTAPSNHLSFSLAVDELDDVHMMLVSLGESACHALTIKHLPDNFDIGLSELFRMSLDRLRKARLAIIEHKPEAAAPVVVAKAEPVAPVPSKPDDPWVKFKAHVRIVEIIRAVRLENGDPVYDRDEDWPEPLRTVLLDLARSYLDKLGEKVGDWHDALAVGSALPWIETVIRRDLLPKTKAAPAKLRDRFILESVEEGFSTADIAQALGMSRLAVDKALYKLKQIAPTEGTTQEEGEAKAS